MRVALLGMGRVGRSMALLLPAAGVEVACWRRGEPLPEADVYWLTLRDDALAEVDATLPAPLVVLHASGALGPEALATHAERGVLHPLMTFPGPEIGLPTLQGAGANVAGTPRARRYAEEIATAIGLVPFEITGDRRLYHAAACLASGHGAALFLQAASVLARAGVPEAQARGLLLPLALESLRRAAAAGPVAITGPASRGDVRTIEAHRAVLSDEERVLYDAGTGLIRSLRVPPGGD